MDFEDLGEVAVANTVSCLNPKRVCIACGNVNAIGIIILSHAGGKILKVLITDRNLDSIIFHCIPTVIIRFLPSERDLGIIGQRTISQ